MILKFIWSDVRLALAAVIGIGVGSGLLNAWLAPRGPVTSAQALISIAAAVVVGVMSGLALGSRWSMLLAPAGFIAAFELARLGVVGPTVDGIHLRSTYGVIAFVLGRGVHGVLVLAPMTLGALYGVWIANRLGHPTAPSMGIAAGSLATLSTLSLILVAVGFAQPGSTHAIVGPDSAPLPGSIAELTTVRLGGNDQALMIRGRSVENPVLLYLAGGPGGTDLGAMRADVSLEQDFIVVTWEQRGAGKSYAALDPASTLTLEGMLSDTIELTHYLRERFDEGKIYLVGNSWGTLLGVLAVQRNPELYHAYVGTGQMVSPRETDILFYEDTLVWAERGDQESLVTALRQNGPPPYANILAYEPALSHEHDWNPYPDLDLGKEMPANLFVPENSLMDRINGLRAFLDTFSILYPQLQELDFRRDVNRLEVPIYIVLGKYEARGRASPLREWFEMLEAPSKELLVFDRSGHRPQFEEPGEFAALMTRVRADSYVIHE